MLTWADNPNKNICKEKQTLYDGKSSHVALPLFIFFLSSVFSFQSTLIYEQPLN